MSCEIAVLLTANGTLCLVLAGSRATCVRVCTLGGYVAADRAGNVGCAVAVVCAGLMRCKLTLFVAANRALCLCSAGCLAILMLSKLAVFCFTYRALCLCGASRRTAAMFQLVKFLGARASVPMVCSIALPIAVCICMLVYGNESPSCRNGYILGRHCGRNGLIPTCKGVSFLGGICRGYDCRSVVLRNGINCVTTIGIECDGVLIDRPVCSYGHIFGRHRGRNGFIPSCKGVSFLGGICRGYDCRSVVLRNGINCVTTIGIECDGVLINRPSCRIGYVCGYSFCNARTPTCECISLTDRSSVKGRRCRALGDVCIDLICEKFHAVHTVGVGYGVCLESIGCFKIDVLIGHIELDSLVRGLVSTYEGETLCSRPTCKVVAGSRIVCLNSNDRAYDIITATRSVRNAYTLCLNRNYAGITVAVCFCVGADDGKCLACPLGKKSDVGIFVGCEGMICNAVCADLVGCAGAEACEIVVVSIKSDLGSRFLNVNREGLFKTGVDSCNAYYVCTGCCACGNGKGDNTVNRLTCRNGKVVGLANAKIGVGSIGRSNGCNNSTCAVLIKNKAVLVKCKTCYRLVGSYRVIVNNEGFSTVIGFVRLCTHSICNLNGNRACIAGCCGCTADVAVICGKSQSFGKSAVFNRILNISVGFISGKTGKIESEVFGLIIITNLHSRKLEATLSVVSDRLGSFGIREYYLVKCVARGSILSVVVVTVLIYILIPFPEVTVICRSCGYYSVYICSKGSIINSNVAVEGDFTAFVKSEIIKISVIRISVTCSSSDTLCGCRNHGCRVVNVKALTNSLCISGICLHSVCRYVDCDIVRAVLNLKTTATHTNGIIIIIRIGIGYGYVKSHSSTLAFGKCCIAVNTVNTTGAGNINVNSTGVEGSMGVNTVGTLCKVCTVDIKKGIPICCNIKIIESAVSTNVNTVSISRCRVCHSNGVCTLKVKLQVLFNRNSLAVVVVKGKGLGSCIVRPAGAATILLHFNRIVSDVQISISLNDLTVVNNEGCRTVIRCVICCSHSICNLDGNRACIAGCCGCTADVAVICGKSQSFGKSAVFNRILNISVGFISGKTGKIESEVFGLIIITNLHSRKLEATLSVVSDRLGSFGIREYYLVKCVARGSILSVVVVTVLIYILIPFPEVTVICRSCGYYSVYICSKGSIINSNVAVEGDFTAFVKSEIIKISVIRISVTCSSSDTLCGCRNHGCRVVNVKALTNSLCISGICLHSVCRYVDCDIVRAVLNLKTTATHTNGIIIIIRIGIGYGYVKSHSSTLAFGKCCIAVNTVNTTGAGNINVNSTGVEGSMGVNTVGTLCKVCTVDIKKGIPICCNIKIIESAVSTNVNTVSISRCRVCHSNGVCTLKVNIKVTVCLNLLTRPVVKCQSVCFGIIGVACAARIFRCGNYDLLTFGRCKCNCSSRCRTCRYSRHRYHSDHHSNNKQNAKNSFLHCLFSFLRFSFVFRGHSVPLQDSASRPTSRRSCR